MLLRRLRAVWRLGRVVVHILHGVWVAWREFDGASAAHRCARIQWWSAKLLALLGMRLQPMGRFQLGPQLVVANHVSWLDIAAVHAVCPQARFVSKSDVKAWPVLGWLIGPVTVLAGVHAWRPVFLPRYLVFTVGATAIVLALLIARLPEHATHIAAPP